MAHAGSAWRSRRATASPCSSRWPRPRLPAPLRSRAPTASSCEPAGRRFASATELPILWCPDGPEAADAAGADACLLVADSYGEDWQRLADDLAHGLELGLDSVVEVRDEEELQSTLEHVDPEIFLLGGEPHDPDEAPIDHVLELLPDVPAGKLAVAYLPDATQDEVEALERAGVDAVVVNASDVRELVGAEPPAV